MKQAGSLQSLFHQLHYNCSTVFFMSCSSELMLMCIERTFSSKDDRDALRECMRILQNFSNYLPTKPVTVPPSATGYKHQHYTKGGNTAEL